jgi:hypothetical protein
MDRVHLSEEEFDRLCLEAPFPWVTRGGGHRYGICEADLQRAVEREDKIYLLDFSIENMDLLGAVDGHYARLLLLPPSLPTLVWRLLRARRWCRINLAVRQYRYARRWLTTPESVWINTGVYVNIDAGQLAVEVERRLRNWRKTEWDR